jgi:hypothetical protein
MKVRLVRVVVQPEYVVDDGENLQPLALEGENGQPGNAVKIVSAKDWPRFTLDEVTAQIQAQVDAQTATEA